jgi:hypothetical protein
MRGFKVKIFCSWDVPNDHSATPPGQFVEDLLEIPEIQLQCTYLQKAT